MATYYARMMDAASGGGGTHEFEGPDDLLSLTADEIVGVFFDEMEDTILKKHVDWELNSVLKNREHGVITALGSLITGPGNGGSMPFVLMISNQKG